MRFYGAPLTLSNGNTVKHHAFQMVTLLNDWLGEQPDLSFKSVAETDILAFSLHLR